MARKRNEFELEEFFDREVYDLSKEEMERKEKPERKEVRDREEDSDREEMSELIEEQDGEQLEEEDEGEEGQEEERQEKGRKKLFLKKVAIIVGAVFLVLVVGVVAMEFFLGGKKKSVKKGQHASFQFNQSSIAGGRLQDQMQGNVLQNNGSALQTNASTHANASMHADALKHADASKHASIQVNASSQAVSEAKKASGLMVSQSVVARAVSVQTRAADKEKLAEGGVKDSDVFMFFGKDSKQQAKREQEKKRISSVPAEIPAPLPLFSPGAGMPVGPVLDKVRVYGIICDERGMFCYAETNLGQLRQGDALSQGQERVVLITKTQIKTTQRTIHF